MRILRPASEAPVAAPEHDPFAVDLVHRVTTLPKASLRRAERFQAGADRETEEVRTIIASRPLGSVTPRDEPKSIHSPTGKSRIGWEPPKARQSTKKAGQPGAGRPAVCVPVRGGGHSPVRGSY